MELRESQKHTPSMDQLSYAPKDMRVDDYVSMLDRHAECIRECVKRTFEAGRVSAPLQAEILANPHVWLEQNAPLLAWGEELANELPTGYMPSADDKLSEREEAFNNKAVCFAIYALAQVWWYERSKAEGLLLLASGSLLNAWNFACNSIDQFTMTIDLRGALERNTLTIAKNKRVNALATGRKTAAERRSQAANGARQLVITKLFPEWRKANLDADKVDGYRHCANVLNQLGYKNANGASITAETIKGYFRKPRAKK